MPKTVLEKINRDEWVEFLDTTPESETPNWEIIGVGITNKQTDYNTEKTEEKWIIHRNKNVSIDGYGLASGVEQTCYKGDKVFEFIDDLRYRLKTGSKAESHVLEIDKYSVAEEQATPKYRARLWTVAIEITSHGGETAKINYTINYTGDPEFGTATFADGKPSFVKETTQNDN